MFVQTDKINLSVVASFVNQKLKDYSLLVKFRLNLTVVFSAVIGYLVALGSNVSLFNIFMLALAGFMVTSSANALNQIIEKDYDKLMKRTANRPLATGRMGISEALLIAGISGVLGLVILHFLFNDLAAVVGAISLISYAFIYTPLKRIHSIAVFVGAIPGALPPVIGWVAAQGVLSYEAYILFSIQFLWQFPHFWAIGWLGADEYKKAGYKLQPTPEMRNKYTAILVITYIVFLIGATIVPALIGVFSYYFIGIAIALGGIFLYGGITLLRHCNQKAALTLMFSSIIYLTLLQVAMVIDRIFL